jgi:hypothetical protein
MLIGIRDRTIHLPASCDVVICYDAAIETDGHERWGDRTLIGMGGYFDEMIQRYPYLVGRCDIVLNDYSTAKFFPTHFPETLFKLLRIKTGIALLQDLTRKPPIVPFRTVDETTPKTDSSSFHYEVMLMDGRNIRVDGISRHQKRFTAAQLLFRVQTLSQSVLSRDTRMIHAGVLIDADENLLGTRASGSRFHLVQRLGLHFIEQYSTYFQLHQYPYTPYPVVHRMQAVTAGMWMLRPRTAMELADDMNRSSS